MSNSSGAMVLGLAIKAYIAGVSGDALPLLAKYGFDGEIEDQGWYARRDLLVMLDETMQSSPRIDMISVGLQFAHFAPFPADLDSVETALASLDPVYQASHQHLPDSDRWEFERVNDNNYLARDYTPYPVNFSYGLVFGLVERYAPQEAHVSVHTEEREDHRVFRIVIR